MRQPDSFSDDYEYTLSSLSDPADTGSNAQRCCPDSRECDRPVSILSPEKKKRGNNDTGRDLLTDPNTDLVDFDSEEGFIQFAKKKKKVTTSFNWADDSGDKKDDGGENGEDGNKDQNNGESGAGDGSGSAGGSGGGDGGDNKKDEDNNAGDAINDDIWDFSGSKKKNKAKTADAFGLPDIPSSDFHEIKLNDSGGGDPDPLESLDFGIIGAKAEKITSGLSAWTSSWSGGAWGWGGLKSPSSENPKPAEEKPKSPNQADDNPWSINRGKPNKKNTTTFNFGSFDEADNTKEDAIVDFLGTTKSAEKKDGIVDFLGTTKSTEKKDLGDFAWGSSTAKIGGDNSWGNMDKKNNPDNDLKETKTWTGEASDDIWGWNSTKKDVSSIANVF